MKTNEAVRDRILRLCQEHDMTINRAGHGQRTAAVQHQEHPVWEKPESEAADHQAHLRRPGDHPGAVFHRPGV